MIINKKRIRSVEKYFSSLKSGDSVVISVPFSDDISDRLIKSGFSDSLLSGETVLPSCMGAVTRFNSLGKYEIHRDQPKEIAFRQIEWTWKEYHGKNGHVERSEITDVSYKRYPRTFISPPSIEITLLTKNNGDKFIVSPVIDFNKENEQLLIHVVNIFLEIFGFAHVLKPNLDDIITAPIKRLNWDILPKGKRPWPELEPMIFTRINRLSKGKQKVVHKRLEFINKYQPDFVAVGRAGFSGYLVFGFSSRNIFVLESTETNNATYVIDKNWEYLSGLTKAEIINNNLHKARIVHKATWFDEINAVIS
ncbi:hypothetical protein D8X75_00010 [Vibrio cholerae]|nr:hypothetical protein [Vibrio cholerae]EGR1426048.1 hypothetical protein [Vibrio cholerae]EGR4435967.1 hypothetical protein [Vibrio cholerae]